MKIDDSLENLIEKHRRNIVPTSFTGPDVNPRRLTLIENRIAFTVIETAVSMGISAKSVERAIKRGEIHAKKLGRRWLIPRVEIEAWLNRKD